MTAHHLAVAASLLLLTRMPRQHALRQNQRIRQRSEAQRFQQCQHFGDCDRAEGPHRVGDNFLDQKQRFEEFLPHLDVLHTVFKVSRPPSVAWRSRRCPPEFRRRVSWQCAGDSALLILALRSSRRSMGRSRQKRHGLNHWCRCRIGHTARVMDMVCSAI